MSLGVRGCSLTSGAASWPRIVSERFWALISFFPGESRFETEDCSRLLRGVGTDAVTGRASTDDPPNLTHSLRSASAAVDDVPSRLTWGVPYDVREVLSGIVTGQVLRDDHARTRLLTCSVLA